MGAPWHPFPAEGIPPSFFRNLGNEEAPTCEASTSQGACRTGRDIPEASAAVITAHREQGCRRGEVDGENFALGRSRLVYSSLPATSRSWMVLLGSPVKPMQFGPGGRVANMKLARTNGIAGGGRSGKRTTGVFSPERCLDSVSDSSCQGTEPTGSVVSIS